MYLKSITLKGFKSFPDRTRLEFGPGVSVVVGPNGSGKSNITDAVLWALGEQSPVAVRGQSMQDVIFAGAPGRQAAKAAEVELVLDDSEGSLGIGVPEVSLVRRLERTGEGEYRLAGARCRLVDVIEMLSDTGLGKEMHSVISQGRVESIVTSKPRERRLLIEEAAGLGKHRKRRRRAHLKLTRTQDNLDRALDVEREARSRLRPLKRKAEAAELHARLERQALETRWELARDDLRAHHEALHAAEQQAAQARARREEVERELGVVAARRESAEEALARRSAQREELSRRYFIAQAAQERVSERTESVRATRGEIEARLQRTQTQLGQLSDNAPVEVSGSSAQRRVAALEAALDALMRDREAELTRQLAHLQQQLAVAEEELQAGVDAAERRQAERDRVERAAERGREELRAVERQLERARRDAAAVGGELAAVNQFLRSQGGSAGARAALADELEVEPGYELAVTAALDGRLRAALVSDRRSAGELLDRAGSDGGRALITGDLASHPADPASEPGAPVDGARRLEAYVRGPSGPVTLARALLRDTWLVDSLDLLPEGFSGIAVTPGGRVWSPRARELRQAPLAGEERVLAQRNRREQLIGASEGAASAELAAAASLERAQEHSSRLDGERERAVSQHRAAVRARDEAREEVRRISAVIERRRAEPEDDPSAGQRLQLEAELSAERAQMQHAEREAAGRRERIARLQAARDCDECLLPAVGRMIEALAAVAEAVSERRMAFEAELRDDRQAGEQVAAELRSCAQQEAALHARLHQQNEALTETEVGLQRARDQVADAEQQVRDVAGRLGLDAGAATEELDPEQRQALAGRLERLARRRELLGPVNPLAQQEYAEALEHVEELERQREDLETALRELERLIADTDRQIRETFEQTFAAAARNFELVSEQLFPGGRGRLRLVSEREGPARVLGDALPHGHDAGSPEEDDQLEASAEETEVPSQEDPLGVEIEITPAGKEMRRLSLLSGGEKSLTALAFLFAVFLARPCPFYVLDEVEAALDDLNIDRFLRLLRGYSKQAQFIVVTHQRRTMEAADSLYGVSMGADAISKVISRRLPAEEQAAA